jgi:glutamate racemase
VLERVRELLPEADLTYLADQANVPYGERSLTEIRDLARAAVAILADRGATTVVVACNTASAAALEDLRSAFRDVVIVGMEPAVKPAAGTTRSGTIGVLATDATFAAARFEDLVGRFAADVEVIAHPCPGWAAAIEESWPDGSEGEVRAHLAPLLDRGVDTLVLACTHYSFLAPVVQRVVGTGVAIVDPASAVARQVERVADGVGSGVTEYLTTGEPHRLSAQIERLLGRVVETSAV